MREAFKVVDGSGEALRIRLGPHDLEDDAAELCTVVESVVMMGRRSLIVLDSSAIEGVTLEAAGALVRLHTRMREADVDVRIAPLHPRVEEKLTRLGVLHLLAPDPQR
jgi:anti-anti-sigma regulatory factor